MKVKRVLVIAFCFLLAFIAIRFLNQGIWDKNEILLKDEVLSIDEDTAFVNLSDITPFEWDTVYTFSPYMPKDFIYSTVGYKWDHISAGVSENMDQIVFLKDGKVVCHLYGYPSNNRYSIQIVGNAYKNGVNILKSDDDLNFLVNRNNGIVYLKQMK